MSSRDSADESGEMIERLRAGDQDAVNDMWDRFAHSLMIIAHGRLRGVHRVADEEDAVISAFDSFVKKIKKNEEEAFPELHDDEGLWRLLVRITVWKALKHRRYWRAVQRGGGKVRGDSAFFDPSRPFEENAGFEQVGAMSPTPELADVMISEHERLLQLLSPDLRQIALWRMEGWTNARIASKLDRSERTIERKLQLIRKKWRKDLGKNPE